MAKSFTVTHLTTNQKTNSAYVHARPILLSHAHHPITTLYLIFSVTHTLARQFHVCEETTIIMYASHHPVHVSASPIYR